MEMNQEGQTKYPVLGDKRIGKSLWVFEAKQMAFDCPVLVNLPET